MVGVDGDDVASVPATAAGSLVLLMMINLSKGAFCESGSHSLLSSTENKCINALEVAY